MEVHYGECKYIVNQWSVCARQEKKKEWMGPNFYQKINRLVLEVLYCLHVLWHRITRRLC